MTSAWFALSFFVEMLGTQAIKKNIAAAVVSLTICDPPRENREKGDCTGTRAMTRHAKCVTMAQICAYLMTKTKSVTVLLFATQKPLSKALCKTPR